MNVGLLGYNRTEYQCAYERYLPDLRDAKVVDTIASNSLKAQSYSQMFDQDELNWIRGYAYTSCTVVRHNDNGTVFISGNLQGVYEKFADKINSIIPGAEHSPVVGGNYFVTNDQYGLHNDSTRLADWENSLKAVPADAEQRRWVPWRNIIIPIYVTPQHTPSDAVFFNERHIDFAHVYNHGHKGEIATTYPVARDYSQIQFHGLDGQPIDKSLNTKEYDEQHYQQYLNYTPKRRLSGLHPELTCEWTPGCPIVFDAVQLHATNKGRNTKWTTKMGLLLTFLKEM